MKIAYIVPGSGGSFYCGNCLRDSSFIRTLKKTGHEIIIIPMYLPISVEEETNGSKIPIFYGAVNLYLKQLSPLFKKMPHWLTHFFDSLPILKYAAKKAGSTRASGLDKMTISMLKGEQGNQADDLEALIEWFQHHLKPDVIHISNALLTGLAPRMKKELNAVVICSLQDEDEWIDEMNERSQKESWKLITENSTSIDAFIAVSDYFKKVILQKVKIPANKIITIHNGIDSEMYLSSKIEKSKNVIGYLNRLHPNFGLHILIDAFILLKKENQFADLKLRISGGYTTDDKPYIRKQQEKLKQAGLNDSVEFIEFTKESKQLFFETVTVFCVPSERKEAFGLQLLESMASGVPVVEPEQGAYPEIIHKSNAGLLYKPNTPEKLAEQLKKILTDKNLYLKLQKNCLNGVKNDFSSQTQVEKLMKVYESCINTGRVKTL